MFDRSTNDWSTQAPEEAVDRSSHRPVVAIDQAHASMDYFLQNVQSVSVLENVTVVANRPRRPKRPSIEAVVDWWLQSIKHMHRWIIFYKMYKVFQF